MKKKPMPMPVALPPQAKVGAEGDTAALYGEIKAVLTQARQQAQRSVNQGMVQAYWHVGKLIVEHEQAGEARAAYGERVLQSLADRLSAELGKGFAVQSLRNFRQLYLAFPGDEIRSMPWSELGWSHLKALMRVEDPAARQWYARESVDQTWSVAALERQISTLYYQRLLSSQDQGAVQAEARSLIELKVGKLSHQDVGQLDMYVRVFDEQIRQPGDNPTLGLILCSERNEAVARYSLLAESQQLFASRYRALLPTEAELQAELTRDRALLESHRDNQA